MVDLADVQSDLDNVKNIKELETFLRDAGGFSKGLALAVLARFKSVVVGEPQSEIDKEAVHELKNFLKLPPL
jgi:hypothetical protein